MGDRSERQLLGAGSFDVYSGTGPAAKLSLSVVPVGPFRLSTHIATLPHFSKYGHAYIFDKFHKYHMKILLGDLSAKVGRETIFKPIFGNQSLHGISNDNGVRVVNFATSKNLIVKLPCSHIATFINILRCLQMGKPTIRLAYSDR
jgi:hypothetical protein